MLGWRLSVVKWDWWATLDTHSQFQVVHSVPEAVWIPFTEWKDQTHLISHQMLLSIWQLNELTVWRAMQDNIREWRTGMRGGFVPKSPRLLSDWVSDTSIWAFEQGVIKPHKQYSRLLFFLVALQKWRVRPYWWKHILWWQGREKLSRNWSGSFLPAGAMQSARGGCYQRPS